MDKDNKKGPNNITKNMEQSLKLESDDIFHGSTIEKEQMETRQRVFNQHPNTKKKEIVFSQIQRINNHLSWLEERVDDILTILKADK